MHRNAHLLSVFKRVFFDDHITLVPLAAHGIETIRGYSGRTAKIVPFKEMLDNRRDEAKRSVVVQVQSEQSCDDLYDYCREFGEVRTMYHYQTPKNTHYVLVELENRSVMEELVKNSSHLDAQQAIPVLSPFLWFKMSAKKRGVKKRAAGHTLQKVNTLYEGNESVLKILAKDVSVSDQLTSLLRTTEIGELGSRLRFLSALQVESALNGLFRGGNAYPFGSSVNGFGREGCDLDLVLVFPEEAKDSRLVFHAKACSADDRLQVQNHIEVIGDLMHCFMPGCVSVKKITQARVPIIKYRHDLTNLDCDLSLYQANCLQMSEILYLLGSLDVRVRELVVAVRVWAKAIGLTNSSPGRWISNFSLTLLVLFFLQQSPAKLLPPLKRLRYRHFLMSPEEFQSYTSELQSQIPENSMKSEEILLKFFQFYSSFDFNSYGLNLLSGRTVVKPDYAAMFIVNPVQPELNVSKNVSGDETERIRAEMRNAAWVLETMTHGSGEPWGLGKLLEGSPQSHALAQGGGRGRPRLVDVKSLFDA